MLCDWLVIVFAYGYANMVTTSMDALFLENLI